MITILAVPLILSVYGLEKNTSVVDDEESNNFSDRILKVFRYSQDNYPVSALFYCGHVYIFYIPCVQVVRN